VRSGSRGAVAGWPPMLISQAASATGGRAPDGGEWRRRTVPHR
jgi:hypothetical protein